MDEDSSQAQRPSGTGKSAAADAEATGLSVEQVTTTVLPTSPSSRERQRAGDSEGTTRIPGTSALPPVRGPLPRIPAYDLVEEIGHGGMGVVYKAIQAGTRRTVALKVIRSDRRARPRVRKLFAREVQLAARLKHPLIVRILESRQDSECLYYAMDYVDGMTLDQHIARNAPPLRELLEMLARVCDAVEYAHRQGVIHCDLKPSNILVDRESRTPHLTDFGVARTLGARFAAADVPGGAESAKSFMGTVPYLSPEQALGADLDARTDVYSLGTVLHEVVVEWEARRLSSRAPSRLRRGLDRVTTVCSGGPGIDADLRAIVRTARERDPRLRYASASALAQDIRRYIAGEPILARQPGALYYARRKMARHRLVSLIAMLLIIVGTTFSVVHYRHRGRELLRARISATHLQNALENNNVGSVIGPARAAWERFPELPEMGLVWAQALRRSRENSRALWFLESEIRKDHSAWAFRLLLDNLNDVMGRPDRLPEVHEGVGRTAPNTGIAWHIRSFATFDLRQALVYEEEARRRLPEDPAVLHRLTDLYLKAGRLQEALEVAERILLLDCNEFEWATFRAHVLVRRGDFREALQLYDHVIRLRPDDPTPYHYRAHALRRLGQYGEAVEAYSTAIRLDGKNVNPWRRYQRLTCLWILGRLDEAIDDSRRVRWMLGRPTYADARLALMLRHAGRDVESRQVLSDALSTVEDTWLHSLLLLLDGQLAADRLIAAAGDDREHQCEAHYYVAEMYLLAGDRKRARQHFEEAVGTGVVYDLDTFPLTPMSEHELARWRLRELASIPTG